MGPTNVSLVKFFFADQTYRAASSKLRAVTQSVRVQEGKVNQLVAEHEAAQRKAMELEAKAKEVELDMRSRETRIELLRQRQTNATNNKEYQSLIVEINTQKLDKGKVEEQALGAMETAGKQKQVVADLKAKLDAENAKLAEMRAAIDDRVKALTAEADAVKGPRDELAAAVSPRIMNFYEKAAERFDGEGMAPIEKPRPKVEEYVCAGCNIELVVDVYNRLHSRDEAVLCPSCGRLLYIPEDLPPEKAIAQKKAPPKPRKAKDPNAPKKAPKSKLDVAVANAKLPQVGDQTLRGEMPAPEGDKPVVAVHARGAAAQTDGVSDAESPADAETPVDGDVPADVLPPADELPPAEPDESVNPPASETSPDPDAPETADKAQ